MTIFVHCTVAEIYNLLHNVLQEHKKNLEDEGGVKDIVDSTLYELKRLQLRAEEGRQFAFNAARCKWRMSRCCSFDSYWALKSI